ncbi:MAG: hypothetical protein WC587_03125 [Candidatus Paceibacterota bacterium]
MKNKMNIENIENEDNMNTDVQESAGNVKKVLLAVFVILFVASLAAAAYFWKQLDDFKNNPQKVAQVEVDNVVNKVGQLMVLPEGEQPTVATVTDPDKLKDQPFFAKAKKGDRVLIYTNARKAILYDEVANKIVEIAPLNIGK